MFETIKKYMKSDDYLISLMHKKVHCYNYYSIKKISDNEIIIVFKEKDLYITGHNFTLKALDKRELLISGDVINIELR